MNDTMNAKHASKPTVTSVEWMILPWVLGNVFLGLDIFSDLTSRILISCRFIFFHIFCFTGFVWAEIKQMWDGGFQDYIHDWWNLMDFVMNSLYLATISLKIVAHVRVTNFNYVQMFYFIPI